MFRKKLKKDIEKKANENDIVLGAINLMLGNLISNGGLSKMIITSLSRYKLIKPQEVPFRYDLAQKSISRHKDELKSVILKVVSEVMSGESSGSSGGYNYGNSGTSSNSQQAGAGYSEQHVDSIDQDLSGAKLNQEGSGENKPEKKEETSSGQSSSLADTLIGLNTPS